MLGPLEARLGKYAILGNHDAEHDPDRSSRRWHDAGFESLEGRWTTIAAQWSEPGGGRNLGPLGTGHRPGSRRWPISGSCSATRPTSSTGPGTGAST